MTNEQLKEFILKHAGDAQVAENQQFLIATVPAASLHSLAKSLKESAETQFDYMYSLTGVDMQPALGVVYHLESTKFRHNVVLKVFTEDRVNPVLPSVTDIWRGAELQECEVFDFFGIKFQNHPDMRRIFLEDDWQGFPLRKDYKDEVNIVDLIK